MPTDRLDTSKIPVRISVQGFLCLVQLEKMKGELVVFDLRFFWMWSLCLLIFVFAVFAGLNGSVGQVVFTAIFLVLLSHVSSILLKVMICGFFQRNLSSALIVCDFRAKIYNVRFKSPRIKMPCEEVTICWPIFFHIIYKNRLANNIPMWYYFLGKRNTRPAERFCGS